MKECVLCGAEYDAEPEMCRRCYSSGMYLAWKMKAVLDVISKAAGHPFEAEATGGGCYALVARLGTPEQVRQWDGPVIMVTEWPDVLSGTSTLAEVEENGGWLLGAYRDYQGDTETWEHWPKNLDQDHGLSHEELPMAVIEAVAYLKGALV